LPGFPARWRQAQRRAEDRRGAGSPACRRDLARQGLHPAARHRGGLPITTVNIAKLGISVYRVNERGLDKFIERLLRDLPRHRTDDRIMDAAPVAGRRQRQALWRGTMDVRNALNQPVTTAFPIRETIKDWKPGAYFIVVWNAANKPIPENEDDDDSNAGSVAGMWVMDRHRAHHLHRARRAQRLRALARDRAAARQSRGHAAVARQRADRQGDHRRRRPRHLPPGLMRGRGAAEPTAVMATDEGKKEFSRLELTKAAFDLSDRGIDGRDLPVRSTPSSTRARRLSAGRNGAADGHAARRFGHGRSRTCR